MRNHQLIKLGLVLILVVLSEGIQLRREINESLLNKLRDVTKESEQGKQMFSMIQLHLSRGGKVDQVIAYVRDALSQSIQDRAELQGQKVTELDRLDTIISSLRNDLTDLNSERETTILRIDTLSKLINTLELRISNLENELNALNLRESFIEAARSNDISAFETRQVRDTNAIQSLNEIITVLNQLLQDSGSDSSLIEKKSSDIKNALSKLKSTDSLKALVEISTGFNRGKLQFVIQKLYTIQNAIILGKQQDEEQEQASAQRYTLLISEIKNLRAEKSFSLQQAISERDQSQAQLNQAQSRKTQLLALIQETQNLLDSNQTIRNKTELIFDNKLTLAQKTIDALKIAEQILSENTENLQSREDRSDQLVAGYGLM